MTRQLRLVEDPDCKLEWQRSHHLRRRFGWQLTQCFRYVRSTQLAKGFLQLLGICVNEVEQLRNCMRRDFNHLK